MLIINADDWGRDRANTDSALACLRAQRLSSVSAMVFMEDSARAAEIARAEDIDAGLHLNLTTAFTDPAVDAKLSREQQKITRFLRSFRYAPALFHPLLTRHFARQIHAQIDEFTRLYGQPPTRIDGHHHMHLCANLQRACLISPGIILRRNFHFFPGEKSLLNRGFRALQDFGLRRRYRIADYFFALPPAHKRDGLPRIMDLATRFNVELETHPAIGEECAYLMSDRFAELTARCGIAPRYQLQSRKAGKRGAR